MWDKIGYLLAIVGFWFVIYKGCEYLEKNGFFVKKDVKNHFHCMQRILSPYSSVQTMKDLQLRYNKKLNEIAKYAKTGKVEKEFIEKSKLDHGAYIFSLIFVLYGYSQRTFCSDEDKAAINALFGFCKKELLKYKEYAPDVFWKVLYLDKECFYQDVVEKG